MTFDASRGQAVLFGGRLADETLSDVTWTWDGDTWAPVSDGGPGPRIHPALGYDEARHAILLAGGEPANDIWSWAGREWTQVVVEPAPSPHVAAEMALHDGIGRLVLFGGRDEHGYPTETWLWDGGAWSRSDAAGPPGRVGHAMAYDPVRGVVVLYGGFAAADEVFTDVWEFDGGSWTVVGLDVP